MANRATPLPANRLRELRISGGHDLTALAAEIGKSVSTYARYEAGQTAIPDDVKLALASKYGISSDYLMGWDREVAPSPLEGRGSGVDGKAKAA